MERAMSRTLLHLTSIVCLGPTLGACDDDSAAPTRCAPEAVERCGGGDEDCDGLVDEPGAEGCRAFSMDLDGDALPDDDTTRCLCEAAPPWTLEPGGGACGDCDDGNPCTEDRCDQTTSACTHSAREGSCTDLDPCTVDTVCLEGVCQGGSELDCDDGNPCTGDLCNAGLGCAHSNLFTSCDDGDRCTSGDECREGRCQGTPLPNCGEPYCGDGRCDPNESCDDCEADCSPLGFGRCGAACDPLNGGCGADALCVPTRDGRLATEILFLGNGVCGARCESNADCATGACLRIEGVSGGGVCRAACDPAAPSCAAGETCLPTDVAGVGACNRGGPCTPGSAEGCPVGTRCVALASTADRGLCLELCSVQEPEGCGEVACQPLASEEVHEGMCLGELTPCDATDGSGCPAGETCAFVGGGAFGGSAPLCQPIARAQAIGDACSHELTNCGLGLVCWRGRCAQACAPADPRCGRGAPCEPIGASFGRAADAIGVCQGACGDGACVGEEGCLSCPTDCGSCPVDCGDGLCAPDAESCESCPEDCGRCPTCGDGACSSLREDCTSCPDDCGGCECGDGTCSPGETCGDCRADCGDCPCGDALCEASETCLSCPGDCGRCPCQGQACEDGDACGDGQCTANEDCTTCSLDCGGCVCGDGRCNGFEDCLGCPEDCGACPCGDGVCQPGEDCGGCEADCGPCRGECGDGFCQDDEDCQGCERDCGQCQVVCGDGLCVAGSEDCSTCRTDCRTCPAVCGDGLCASPEETCLTCPGDCGFFGIGTCDGTCDPTAPRCADNYLCMPSDGGMASPRVYGDGFCARTCDMNADCGGGTCAELMPGGQRLCVSGRTCDPRDRDDCDVGDYCVVSTETDDVGYCAPGCDSASPGTCGGVDRCVAGRGGIWAEGVCVGQDTPCAPGTQSGCQVGRTCMMAGVVDGSAVTACSRRVGILDLGGRCDNTDDPARLCKPGLLCDDDDRVCRTPCVPGGASCTTGQCADIGRELMPGIMGVCR